MAQETLGLRRGGISPPLTLLMSAYSLVNSPLSITIQLLRVNNALLPRDKPEGLSHPELRYRA